MSRLFSHFFIFTLLISPAPSALAGTSVLTPPERFEHERLRAEAKRASLEAIQLRHGASKSDSWAPVLPPSPIDVITYDLDIHLDMERHIVSGTIRVLAEAVDDSLGTIGLEADQGLRIFGVTLVEDLSFPSDSSRSLDFTH